MFDFEMIAMSAPATTVRSLSKSSQASSPAAIFHAPMSFLETYELMERQGAPLTSTLATYTQQEERAERIVLGVRRAAIPPLDASLLQILETL
jgi:hypothetical protein